MNTDADPVLNDTLSALTTAQSAGEIRVLAARALRLLAAAAQAAQPEPPAPRRADRKARDKAAAVDSRIGPIACADRRGRPISCGLKSVMVSGSCRRSERPARALRRASARAAETIQHAMVNGVFPALDGSDQGPDGRAGELARDLRL